ncbi:hypothetical protein ACLB2K_036611 [Fragaria x ananassa]
MTIGDEKTESLPESDLPINENSPLLHNPHEETAGGSFSGAVFNLSTTIIGAGIMALPATMKVLGLGVGIGMIVFVAVLTEAAVEMLLRFSRAGNASSFGGVMGDAFGTGGRVVFQLSILVNNLGTLIVYMIILGDVLSGTASSGVHHTGVLEGWFGENWWNGRLFVLFVTTIFVFGPLVSLKRIDSLRYSSALAVGLAGVFLVITAGITAVKISHGDISMPRLLPVLTDLTSVWNLFTVVPVLVTAFICHFNVHTISNELKKPIMIQPVVRTSLGLCSSVYILTSLFGFLLFGDSILDDVLANFDTDLGIPYSSMLSDIVRISYALHLMLVFPIIFHPLRINFDDLFFPSSRPLDLDNRRFALITLGLISIIFLGANFIPSIWDVFQFTGATATVCIGFIFPAAIVLRDRHGIATSKDKTLSVFMIGLAVFANLIAVYSDAVALLKKNVSPHA